MGLEKGRQAQAWDWGISLRAKATIKLAMAGHDDVALVGNRAIAFWGQTLETMTGEALDADEAIDLWGGDHAFAMLRKHAPTRWPVKPGMGPIEDLAGTLCVEDGCPRIRIYRNVNGAGLLGPFWKMQTTLSEINAQVLSPFGLLGAALFALNEGPAQPKRQQAARCVFLMKPFLERTLASNLDEGLSMIFWLTDRIWLPEIRRTLITNSIKIAEALPIEAINRIVSRGSPGERAAAAQAAALCAEIRTEFGGRRDSRALAE